MVFRYSPPTYPYLVDIKWLHALSHIIDAKAALANKGCSLISRFREAVASGGAGAVDRFLQ